MTTEQYSIGYEAGYQDGFNEAIDDIKAAVLAEREACAKVCDDYGPPDYVSDLSAAIRARSTT